MQAIYFDRSYHNETTARLWWDDHKAFFDTREQLIQYVLTSGRKTLRNVASRLRRSRASSVSSAAPPSAVRPLRRRQPRSPSPEEYAATAAAAANAPPVEPPAGYPFPLDLPEGENGGQLGHASEEVLAAAQAYVAQQMGGAEEQDMHAYAHDRDAQGPVADSRGVYTPPSQPLV